MSGVICGIPKDMPPRNICVGFTGHRPRLLPWGGNEADPRCVALKQELEQQIEREYSMGARYFLSGMADGIDTYAAEAVLKLAGMYPDIRLIAVFPYGTGNSARQRRLAGVASRVISLYPQYLTGCMQARDRFLAEHSSAMICVLAAASGSGTSATMRMALESGVRLTVLRI